MGIGSSLGACRLARDRSVDLVPETDPTFDEYHDRNSVGYGRYVG